jgi:hypothetical protein
MSIDVTFLRDVEHGGQASQPVTIAHNLSAFISSAQSSLHFAIYDFRLHEGEQPYNLVVNALKERAQAGVEVNIAFDAGRPNPAASGSRPLPLRPEHGRSRDRSARHVRSFLKIVCEWS